MPGRQAWVLCEKPFAMSAEEAAEITAVCSRDRAPILVGAMHTFDPAWRRPSRRGQICRAIVVRHPVLDRVAAQPRFEDFSTEVINRRRPASRRPTETPSSGGMGHGVMGLAIHDLPLVRALLAASTTSRFSRHAFSADRLPIVFSVGGKRVELHG